MDLSVAMGTYSRAHQLKATLEALASQDAPVSLAWELAVDNNSFDKTPRVVPTVANGSAIPVRYVCEPQQRLSHARNAGIEGAKGDVIAFTDDDVIPAHDWITRVLAAIGGWKADGVGGRILPLWETAPPRWLTANQRLLGHLTIMEFQEGRLLSFPMRGRPKVCGANMRFRRELFDEVGAFDSWRGARAGKLCRGDDSELINRALERGLRIAYDPSLTVLHWIGGERMRRAYFRKYAFDTGEGNSLAAGTPNGARMFGALVWRYRIVGVELAGWLANALLRRGDRFEWQVDFLSEVGQLFGYWKMQRVQGRSLTS